MKKTKVEKVFEYRGLQCIVTHHATRDQSWRCGYVVVGRNHWSFEDDYDLMPRRETYGQVNYTDYHINFDRAPLFFRIKHWIKEKLKLSWYIGFDSNYDYMKGNQGIDIIIEECKGLADDLVLINKDKGEFRASAS